ncbi:MAG TPA: zinc-binding dehydrogenase [Xanthobacteraceae bacterium]|jgi:NADPH:quinone reductase-like Zn-dependent oxidoreductase|nr:zinc-binding dehydrogenase [Xanthobacteraceae bacterium]
MMMKAVLIRRFGGPEVLNYEDVTVPEAKPEHVVVKVSAVGTNYYDLLIRSGIVSQDIPLPHVGGSDVVGEIALVGAGVKSWSVGDKVIVAPGYPTKPEERLHQPENDAPSYFPAGTFEWGGYAQYMQVHSRWLLRDDTGLPPEELSTIPLVLVTAVHAVKTLGKVTTGNRVLVQAGASGSGSMAIQVAKALGASVIATVSTKAKADVARRMGADEIIFYKQTRVLDAVREWTRGDGVDVVIDPVGGSTFADSLDSLKPRGTIVNFGLTGGAEATIPHLYPFFRNERRILGSWMGSMEELRFGLDLVRKGRIRAALDKVLPLRDAPKAHQLISDGAVAGKIALLPWAA